MRLILKAMLFPVRLGLSVLIAVCRFFCSCTSGLLSVASLLLFTLALLSLVLTRNMSSALLMGTIAFLISFYGIPLLVEWLIDRLDDLNFTIKSI